jgi:hypothetical protein
MQFITSSPSQSPREGVERGCCSKMRSVHLTDEVAVTQTVSHEIRKRILKYVRYMLLFFDVTMGFTYSPLFCYFFHIRDSECIFHAQKWVPWLNQHENTPLFTWGHVCYKKVLSHLTGSQSYCFLNSKKISFNWRSTSWQRNSLPVPSFYEIRRIKYRFYKTAT